MLSCFSCVQLFATLWIVAHQVPPGRPNRLLRGDPKAFGLPIQWLYPLMMAEKESRKDGIQRRRRTLFLAGGISYSFSCIPYSKHHSAYLSRLLLLIHLAGIVPVTLPLLSLLHPLVEGSWIAKRIGKQSNDRKNGEKIKIWLFSGGKTGIVTLRLTTSPDIKKHMKLNPNIMVFFFFFLFSINY